MIEIGNKVVCIGVKNAPANAILDISGFDYDYPNGRLEVGKVYVVEDIRFETYSCGPTLSLKIIGHTAILKLTGREYYPPHFLFRKLEDVKIENELIALREKVKQLTEVSPTLHSIEILKDHV